MARPRKSLNPSIATGRLASLAGLSSSSSIVFWAESLGEALGRGVARGINSGLAANGSIFGFGQGTAPRGRGRPPKFTGAIVPTDRQCKSPNCTREARSKGLCSAHYQAERRRQLARS
jgi:hypothetical protein